jgi:hypothetical protein
MITMQAAADGNNRPCLCHTAPSVSLQSKRHGITKVQRMQTNFGVVIRTRLPVSFPVGGVLVDPVGGGARWLSRSIARPVLFWHPQ